MPKVYIFLKGFQIFSVCVGEPFDNSKQGCPNQGVPGSIMRPETTILHTIKSHDNLGS
jgi:hypothetical protein